MSAKYFLPLPNLEMIKKDIKYYLLVLSAIADVNISFLSLQEIIDESNPRALSNTT
jgi:hypothetical protein